MDCNYCDGSGLRARSATDEVACAMCGGTGKVRNTTTQAASIKALRKSIRRARGPEDTFRDGDVVKWIANGRYTYAALRANGQWWFTGHANYYGHGPHCTYLQLSRILARPETSDIRVASAWSAI